MKRGDLVYDKHEPRHHGVVLAKFENGRTTTVNVRWIDTGWQTFRIPIRRLRRVSPAARAK